MGACRCSGQWKWLRQLGRYSGVRDGRQATHAALDGHEEDSAPRLAREQGGMLRGFVHRSVMVGQ